MNKTNKQKYIEAHYRLAKNYLKGNPALLFCPLCLLKSRSPYSICTLKFLKKNCYNMKTLATIQYWERDPIPRNCLRAELESSRKNKYKKVRGIFHIKAIKILKTIPKKRFTIKGYKGFKELFDLDIFLYNKYLKRGGKNKNEKTYYI